MKYRFKTTPTFRRSLRKLSRQDYELAKRAFGIFKEDPFDSRLGTHPIHSLSARFKRPVYSVKADGDLRVVFVIDGDTVVSMDIGSHDIYR